MCCLIYSVKFYYLWFKFLFQLTINEAIIVLFHCFDLKDAQVNNHFFLQFLTEKILTYFFSYNICSLLTNTKKIKKYTVSIYFITDHRKTLKIFKSHFYWHNIYFFFQRAQILFYMCYRLFITIYVVVPDDYFEHLQTRLCLIQNKHF